MLRRNGKATAILKLANGLGVRGCVRPLQPPSLTQASKWPGHSDIHTQAMSETLHIQIALWKDQMSFTRMFPPRASA